MENFVIFKSTLPTCTITSIHSQTHQYIPVHEILHLKPSDVQHVIIIKKISPSFTCIVVGTHMLRQRLFSNIGSMDKEKFPLKLPRKSIKRIFLASYKPLLPYHPTKFATIMKFFINDKVLNNTSTRVLKGNFQNLENKKVGLFSLLDTFQGRNAKKIPKM